jgi:hypothetical protein
MTTKTRSNLLRLASFFAFVILICQFLFSLISVAFSFSGPEADPDSDRVNPAEVAWNLVVFTHMLSASLFGIFAPTKIRYLLPYMGLIFSPSFFVAFFAMIQSGGSTINWSVFVWIGLWASPLVFAWFRFWASVQVELYEDTVI